MNTMQKRAFLKVTLAMSAVALVSIPHTHAQAPASGDARYPSKPIRIVVGFPPGGATDILARILGPQLTNAWGQPVVIDNRGGATGTIAADMVSRATPDGYTLMMVPSGPFTGSAALLDLPYDTATGFASVSLLAWVTNALVVPANSPVNNLQDLIRLAKEKPGQVTNGSSGNGSLHHLAGEVFKKLTGTQITHVPFKGGGPVMVALAAGEITFAFSSVPSVQQLIQSKRLKAIVVTSTKRSATMADVPTIAEAGLPLPAGLEMREWYGVVAPLKVPRPIIAKLNAEMVKIYRRPDVSARLAEMGTEAAGSTPEELAKQIINDVRTWTKVVKDAGIKSN